jgi:hypothetical protein
MKLHSSGRYGVLLLVGAFALTLQGAGASRAADATPAAVDKSIGADFDEFCAEWMQRLRTRQRRNDKATVLSRHGNVYSGQFVGYSHKPVKCQARATGSAASPYVGQIVYHEIRFERTGRTLKSARRSKPTALLHTEVLEIFRHNGSKWIW